MSIVNPEKHSRAIYLCDQIAEKGIYFLIFFLPLAFFPAAYWSFDTPKVTLLRLLTVVILAAWVSRGIMAREFKVLRPPTTLAVLSYLFIFALSTLLSISPITSFFGEGDRNDGLLTIANMVLLYFLTVNTLTTTRQFLFCLKLLVVSATVVSGIGILQYFGLDLPGTDISAGRRVFSTLSNPDYLFSYLALAIPVTIGICIKSPLRYSFPLLIMLVCVVLTLPSANVQEDTPATPKEMLEIAPARAEFSINVRLPIWQTTLRTIQDHPILGSGPNTLKHTITRYQPLEMTTVNMRYDKAHNEFLEVPATMGILGLLVYLWLLFSLGRYLLRNLFIHRLKTTEGAMAAGIMLSFLVYTAQSIVMFHTLVGYTFFWLIMAVGAGIYITARPAVSRWRFEVPRPARLLVLPIGTALLLFLLFLSIRPLVADVYYEKSVKPALQGRDGLAEQALLVEKALWWNGYVGLYNLKYLVLLSELVLDTRDAEAKERILNKAMKRANLAVERNPQDAFWYFLRAMVLSRMGESWRPAMIGDLERAVELYPNYYHANYILASAEMSRSNFERAIAARKAALRVMPGDFGTLFQLGEDYFKAGNTSLAIETWEKARQVDPQSAKVNFALGLAHEKMASYEQAKKYYEAAKQITPDFPGIEEAIRRVKTLLPQR